MNYNNNCSKSKHHSNSNTKKKNHNNANDDSRGSNVITAVKIMITRTTIRTTITIMITMGNIASSGSTFTYH